jgi:lysophospholipase L1-like esterase
LDLPATRAALAAGQPITIVAFGSSSTEGSGATTPAHAYPARLQALLRAAWPNVPVTVLNRGKGGQTTDAMLGRLDTDVLAAHPTLVIWQDGANAALRGMEPERFGALLSEGVRRIVASGADLVLMDNQVAPRLEQTAHHATFIAMVAQEAAARRLPFFSRSALMREWHAADPTANDMIGADGLHHTDRGYECLAEALGRAILAPVSPAIMTAQGKRD